MPLAQVAAGGTAVGTNAFLNQQTGTNLMGTLMFPNLFHSALIGSGLSIFKKQVDFGGMFGYKALLRGIQKPTDWMTSGGLVLPMAELAGRGMLKAGFRSPYMHALANARRVGLGGLTTTMEFRSIQEANAVRNVLRVAGENEWFKEAKFGRTEFERRARLHIGNRHKLRGKQLDNYVNAAWKAAEKLGRGGALATTGLAGKDITSAMALGDWDFIDSPIAKSGKGHQRVIGTLKVGSTEVGGLRLADDVIKYGSTIAKAAKVLGFIDLLALGYKGAMWTAGNFMEGAAQAISYGHQQMRQVERLDFGNNELNPVFNSPTASTERMRAVRSIYGAKVNPAQRIMGNEARYQHR